MILEQLKIDHLLDAVIDGTQVERSKPHPEVFLKGARALGKEPAHCVVFEDAVAGIEAAKAGGMRSIGIGTDDNLGEADLVRASLAEVNVEEALNIL